MIWISSMIWISIQVDVLVILKTTFQVKRLLSLYILKKNLDVYSGIVG